MSELNPVDFDGEDLSAGEYALGVLDRAERAAAEARMAAEPRFAREVEAWQERLYPMADAVKAVEPPAHVWPLISRGLGPVGAKVVDLAQRRAVVFLRGWAVAASAIAAVSLLFLGVRPNLAPPVVTPPAPAAQPLLVAELTDTNGRGFITATFDPATGVLHTTPTTALPVPKTRSPELWLIPADGTPRSLGVIDTTHATTVKVSDALRPGAKAQAVLAITLEQSGGSPDGKPHAKPTWVGKMAAA